MVMQAQNRCYKPELVLNFRLFNKTQFHLLPHSKQEIVLTHLTFVNF
ncbi:hypothetical protein EJ73_01061 [Hoylesella shahii DSM 15611 = JCM 12083]|uniref:Uncharacterized protein n=1 Tax=Hoylesella shahii DSM 15611 = JCM 12083 TaxID=1122991 RepID=A0A318I5I9_9BACT|nr:hypothetical protein EJ73_01061 [Hoylesella shahii DSM 15611 = JCM 12083]